MRWLSLFVLGIVWMPGAAPAVNLVRWAGEGVVFPGRGAGDQVGLVALARWDRGTAIGPGRYALRVTMPDGRVETRAFPTDTPSGRARIDVMIPAAAVRDRLPDAVRVEIAVVDARSGAVASNVLAAGIEQFPRPRGEAAIDDPGPFGWGSPLADSARILPRPGPDGFRFARIVAQGEVPGFFVATTEASNKQVGERLPGYDPKAGRSDEFALEAPDQPALGLIPARARAYLKALAEADRLHLSYRPPTRDEWLRAARGGQAGAFWWGDESTHPEGANLLGPEPALEADASAPSDAGRPPSGYRANPFGLVHTFGNVDEWTIVPDGGFARMGGHFRTEPVAIPSEVVVKGDDTLGPDPFVGVRPAFDLSAEAGAVAIRRAIDSDGRFRTIGIAFDPDTATATLTGRVADPATRRLADRRVADGPWFVAAVANRLETPRIPPGRLARLGSPAGPPRQSGSLGRPYVEIALSVAWSDPLPVAGSAWWVNVYLPGGGHVAHRLVEGEPGRSKRVVARVERGRWPVDGLGTSVALSLGAPAPTITDPRIVSDVAPIRRASPVPGR